MCIRDRNGGTEDARITYRSEQPLGAVITGAEPVDSWEPYQGNVWVCRIDNGVFGSYNPYTTFVGGDWYFAPVIRHTGAVYLNDRQLYETQTLEECIKGEDIPLPGIMISPFINGIPSRKAIPR